MASKARIDEVCLRDKRLDEHAGLGIEVSVARRQYGDQGYWRGDTRDNTTATFSHQHMPCALPPTPLIKVALLSATPEGTRPAVSCLRLSVTHIVSCSTQRADCIHGQPAIDSHPPLVWPGT